MARLWMTQAPLAPGVRGPDCHLWSATLMAGCHDDSFEMGQQLVKHFFHYFTLRKDTVSRLISLVAGHSLRPVNVTLLTMMQRKDGGWGRVCMWEWGEYSHRIPPAISMWRSQHIFPSNASIRVWSLHAVALSRCVIITHWPSPVCNHHTFTIRHTFTAKLSQLIDAYSNIFTAKTMTNPVTNIPGCAVC